MPVSAKDGISALCSADNCSTADTSFGDRTLASFTGNAPSISSLPPLDKHADRETSPKPKHRVVSADVAAIENWRPNVSTIKEKSTDSAGSAVDQQPYHPKEPEAKSLAKPRRRPEASLDCHSVAIAEARHIENSAREVSASSFTTDPDGCYSPLLAPLEKEPKGKAAETPRLSLFHTSRRDKREVPKRASVSGRHIPSDQTATDDFDFPSHSRLPLFTMPAYQQPASTRHDPPGLKGLPPDLQSIARRKLRPDAGEKERAAAAILMECFLGSKIKSDHFHLPSASRLPLYGGIKTDSWKQQADANIGEPTGRSHQNLDFSLPQRSHLPLISVGGAEARGALFTEKQSCEVEDWTDSVDHFGFQWRSKLPPLASLFKSPMETCLTGTLLAKNGQPLQVLELANSRKKGHLLGSIESVGEYIRPNADSSFLFSITPFSKLELREKKKTNELLFGKLEKAGREHGKPSIVNIGEGSKPGVASRPQLDRDQQSTEDRNRFNALVSRLQQKLSEQSESDRRSTSTTMRRPPMATDGSDSRHSQTASSSRRNTSVAGSRSSVGVGEGGQATAHSKDTGQLLEHGPRMNYGTMSGSGSSATTRTETTGEKSSASAPSHLATGSAETDRASEGGKQAIVPAVPDNAAVDSVSANVQGHIRTRAIPQPSSNNNNNITRPAALPISQPIPVAAVAGQAPHNPLAASIPRPGPSGQILAAPSVPAGPAGPVGPGMLPQSGGWQGLPLFPPPPPPSHVAQIPGPFAAPFQTMPWPAAANTSTEQRWPMPGRPSRRKRAPYVAFNAAEQQKIEEHIELLKSTIPNFATVSKRRQQMRWEREQDRAHRQGARNNMQQVLPYPPQPANWLYQQQQQQQPPQMQPMYPGLQCQQPGYPMMGPRPPQAFLPYVQPIPANLGMYTWPMPGMNGVNGMNMAF